MCLAISLVTGPMIRETVQIARAAKQLYPDKPIILGGWHPSLLPDQTLACQYVDVVVKGQGEVAMLEILQHIEAGESMKGIEGVGYKENGRIVFNVPRALKPIRELPPKAYHLADFNAYQKVSGRRWAMYTSSLACPYNCAYCTNDGVYGRKWNALEAGQVVEETTDLVSRYGLSLLWIVDDNFLVDRDRAVQIAEGLVRRNVKFEWSIQGSTNLVTRLSVDELKLLRRAGLSQVSQGADSGSPKILHLMNKDFQELDTIYEAANLLTQAGIRPSFNMIFGFPGEGDAERRESIQLIMNVCRRYPGAEFWTNIFTPYPGSPIMQRAFELGIDVPKTLEGWADFPATPRAALAEWQKAPARAGHARLFANRVNPDSHWQAGPPPAESPSIHNGISIPARWRLDHDCYAAPFELWLKKCRQPLVPAAQVRGRRAHQLSAEAVFMPAPLRQRVLLFFDLPTRKALRPAPGAPQPGRIAARIRIRGTHHRRRHRPGLPAGREIASPQMRGVRRPGAHRADDPRRHCCQPAGPPPPPRGAGHLRRLAPQPAARADAA